MFLQVESINDFVRYSLQYDIILIGSYGGLRMKEEKISFIKLSLVLLGYFIYNILYHMVYYSSGLALFVLLPFFLIDFLIIFFGNFFLLRDQMKIHSDFNESREMRFLSSIQLGLALIGLLLQLSGIFTGELFLVNYISHFEITAGICLIYSVMFIIGLVQKIKISRDYKSIAKLSVFFGILLILFSNVTLLQNRFASISYARGSLQQSFKEIGLKGSVTIKEKKHVIEPNGETLTKLTYEEKLSDGTNLTKNLTAVEKDLNRYENEYKEDKIDFIQNYLSEEEKTLFNQINYRHFHFLFDLYRENEKIRSLVTKFKKTVHEALGVNLFEKKLSSLIPINKGKLYSAILSKAILNRENGDTDAAGFYNIDPVELMNSKLVYMVTELIFYSDLNSKLNDRQSSSLNYFKEKLTSMPKGSFIDGIYKFSGSVLVNGKTQDIISTFVVEDGIGHFEKDVIKGKE